MTNFEFSSTGDDVVQAFPLAVRGKTIIITGPTPGGIGAGTALSLSRASPELLILAGRSLVKVQPLIDDIKISSPSVSVKFVALDLGSQASVRKAAAEINTLVEKVDILINNGGVMACPYALSEDGIETQFATNYLGHFLLTALLANKLKRAGEKARVVNVSSSVWVGSPIRWDDVNFQEGKAYEPMEAYAQSKRALVMFSRELATRGIISFSLHPGSIKSGLQVHIFNLPGGREAQIAKAREEARIAGRTFVSPQRKTVEQGCSTTLVAALDPSIEAKSGAYLLDGDIAAEQPPVTDEECARLWALGEKLVGEKFEL